MYIYYVVSRKTLLPHSQVWWSEPLEIKENPFQVFAAIPQNSQDFWFCRKVVPQKGSIHFSSTISAQECKGAGKDGYQWSIGNTKPENGTWISTDGSKVD